MTTAVHIWWTALRIAAALNIAAWTVSAAALTSRRDRFPAAEYRWRRLLLWLSAGYVAGCAFRSFLPRIDLERICLAATPLSSMTVGRSVATAAELCFIAQCALLLHRAGRGADSKFAVAVSLLLFPLIVIAEGASWYAILSTNYLGHVAENSLWTFCAVLLLASFFSLWPHSSRPQRRFLAAMIIFTIGYVAFMAGIDLPMYWSRWTTELTAGVKYLSLTQGLRDASRQCIVSFDWEVWHEEIPWMTLYFTAAVWVSIALPHAPAWLNGALGQTPAKAGRRAAGN
jgi:hypothetical protein